MRSKKGEEICVGCGGVKNAPKPPTPAPVTAKPQPEQAKTAPAPVQKEAPVEKPVKQQPLPAAPKPSFAQGDESFDHNMSTFNFFSAFLTRFYR